MDSSHRSSIAASHHFKRIRRRQEVDAALKRVRRRQIDAIEKTMTKTDNPVRSRLYSHSSSEKPPSVSSACSTKDRRRKEKTVSQSEAPVLVLLRTLFTRCFVSRRKRRTRDRTTRKPQRTRDDAYSHIPTNAHEMFFQLHSKSKRSVNGHSVAGSSNNSRSPANRSRSRQFSHNSRDRSASFDTKPLSRYITPPVIEIDCKSETDPFLLS